MPLVYLATSGFILFAVIMREKIFEDVFEDVRESPVVCVGVFGGTFACEVEASKSIKHISKNSPKSSKIPAYTRRANILRDVKDVGAKIF